MKLASFFSGGKDSTYSIFVAKNQGHSINCLLTIIPNSEQSLLFHHPNILWTKLQSQSMQIPQLVSTTNSENIKDEADTLEQLLLQAKDNFGIDGLVHGGISSKFQRSWFDDVCKRCNIKVFSPLWDLDTKTYMNKLLEDNFQYVIVGVSSGGLDESWLGRTITKNNIKILEKLSTKHGFNLNFEGGEAETFVTDCPLFSQPIIISKKESFWDGYRGRFEIIDARLSSNA